MKKFGSFLLILICFSSIILISTPVFAATMFKEGIYTISDLSLLPENTYVLENTSSNNSVYVFILDNNGVIKQSIQLNPTSSKYNLLPMKPDYKIVIIGKGEVSIS